MCWTIVYRIQTRLKSSTIDKTIVSTVNQTIGTGLQTPQCRLDKSIATIDKTLVSWLQKILQTRPQSTDKAIVPRMQTRLLSLDCRHLQNMDLTIYPTLYNTIVLSTDNTIVSSIDNTIRWTIGKALVSTIDKTNIFYRQCRLNQRLTTIDKTLVSRLPIIPIILQTIL